MSATALALLIYIALTLALLLVMEVMRSVLVLKGSRAGNDFKPDGLDVSPFAHRLARAHANYYESFPIIAGLLLLALVTGQTEITDPLAPWLIVARAAQSIVHLASTSKLMVRIRFTFFAIQLLIALWWLVRFFGL